jgi:L-aspartate oxidase
VRATPSITVLEGYVAEALLTERRRVTGVIARGDGGAAVQSTAFPAAATVLATGGLGYLYSVTTNPPEARGLGLAIAAQAGALIADPEFVQFHPTAIDIGRDPAPLATEALRGEGATLIDRDGVRFMLALHPDAELAPRDVVARGVFASIAAGKGAFLDAREAVGAAFGEKFPTVMAACLAAGIDPVREPIPVAPAEHYHMGGIWTDGRGRTSLDGLWAAGEVASTGVHGANRLASNSLLEAIVFSARIAADIRTSDLPPIGAEPGLTLAARPGLVTRSDEPLVRMLRTTMQQDVGVIRSGEGLRRALRQIERVAEQAESIALSNMADTARLVVAAALARRESRGGHFRSDFPSADPAQASRIFLRLSDLDARPEARVAAR